jgi:hypothetical protein
VAFETEASALSAAERAVAAAPAPKKPGALARFKAFASSRRHDFPGVVALTALAILEVVSVQFIVASDLVNQHGLSALTDGRYQPQFDIGIAGIFLPFVIAAWLFGKRRPIRILFKIAIWSELIGLIALVITILGTINAHAGNVGAATLLANAGLLWVMNVTVFALWYWSTDGGGPDLRGTPAAKRPDFDFPQQRSKIHGWEGWVPGFHDYLHAAFVISLGFHAGVAEVLSARAKYVNMLQAGASVAILLLLVAKAIATFTPGG